MNVKILVAVLIITGIFSQNVNLSQLNGCALDTLGNSLPLEEQDCFKDRTKVDFNCCFVKAAMQGVSVNFCYPLPKNSDITALEQSILNYGPSASVKCSATSISLSLMLIAILSLFLI